MRRLPDDIPSPSTQGPGRGLIGLIVVAFLLLTVLSSAVGYYVDMLWFESLGFLPVFWTVWKAQGAAFLVFFVATTAVLFSTFAILISLSGATRRPFLQLQGRIVEPPSIAVVKRVAAVAAVVVGLFFGISFSSGWQTFALYLHQPAASGSVDPAWGKPLAFYFFTLPVYGWGVDWLTGIAVVSLAAAILLFVVGITVNLRGISAAGSLFALALAARAFLGRYQLVLDDHNLISGMRYVEDKAVATGLLLTAAALVLAALLLLLNRRGTARNIGVAVVLPVLTYVLGCMLVPWYLQTFVVRPNELALETPYIHRNIEATRVAYGLDTVEVVPYEPRETGIGFDPVAHKSTLDNLRLWDWKALQDTLRQIQEIRTYYDFPDVDIDRYTIDGKPTATMLAVREVDINKLPAGSRNWVNDRLTYTHGYGITMNSANQFTKDGLPEFLLSNMPVVSTRPELQLKRPEIYFGELTSWPVYVKTQQKEFNYPEGEANNYTAYEGTGGIRMGGFFRRLLLSAEVGDLLTAPFSKDITSESSLLLHRNIVDRASRLAPFLTFDTDPYMVVSDDGGLYWILDAYTTSDKYPYSRHAGVGNAGVNYIRNSAKVVIDAYNGTVSFYVFDEADPLINAYRGVFPELFKPRSAMPEYLQKHIRYPELLFELQASLYASYHVDSEQVFYNREDVWSIAEEARAQGGNTGVTEPIFSLMRFPGEEQVEFVSILSFTPSKRNNMIGWLAGRSDGEHYGKLRAYHLPKTKFVDGPLQVESRIDQDPQLSSQLTLWNQQGSVVIRGSMLAIPIEDTLLFAEPIYLQAQRSPMPALRLIVLATQDRLGFGTTFDEALKQLLAGGGGSLAAQAQSTTPSAPQGAPAAAPATVGLSNPQLIGRANQALTEYRRLTAEGRMAEAGAKLDELKSLLERLNAPGGK